MITFEIGLGKATKATVHYYYREWKNGVTEESDSSSQLTLMKQHISQWKEIADSGGNFVALGDANLCALSWNDQNFRYKELADEVQNFLLEESCFQLVNKATRIQTVGGRIQKSCLDHITTNIPEKCSDPEVFNEGSSDHLPIMVTKFSREVRTQPKTIKKRNYKNFVIGSFLLDVQEHVTNGAFDKVIKSENVHEASALFSGIFGYNIEQTCTIESVSGEKQLFTMALQRNKTVNK